MKVSRKRGQPFVLLSSFFAPAILSTALAATAPTNTLTALDRYVASPDTNYHFKPLISVPVPGGTVHILEMTSQAWLTTNEVDSPVWKHWLAVTCPDQVAHGTALLHITSGSKNQPAPATPAAALTRTMGNFVRLAVETKSIVIELHDVPNQPLVFGNDGERRLEDNLQAYTFDRFLRTGDEHWPVLLPMTKSAVRAMDTVHSFCATNSAGRAVDRFVLSGMSKRGWTTWLTAAVDPRVVAIAPMVIDVLNIEPSLRHHYAAYGFWAPAVRDYDRQRVLDRLGTPQFKALGKIEDPYEYRARYTMPKLLLNAAGDQFFLPDSAQFYFNDLPGPKYLRYVPNADHSLRDTDVWETLAAFYRSILNQAALPRFEWSFEQDGAIALKAVDEPKFVALWQATNPNARDFRVETFGPKWTRSPITLKDGAGRVRVPAPVRGWTAFFAELTFEGADGKPLKLTTPVRVVPDKTDHKFVPATF